MGRETPPAPPLFMHVSDTQNRGGGRPPILPPARGRTAFSFRRSRDAAPALGRHE